ncbi:MAG TPA: HAD-IIB family hydrolase [Tenericutes bacterium]|jgi:Cof subfamily protein (haloacid dehalogenase superfamily)|nr:HAD-IIB family hydrolase [Mycoplasmatota bacterium]
MKIIFSDYDGTLYKKDKKLLKENIKAIKVFREDGNLFCVATGRTYLDIKRLLEKRKIPYDYVIANDGAIAFDNKGNKLYTIDIDLNDVLLVSKDIKENSGVQFWGFTDGKYIYIEKKKTNSLFLNIMYLFLRVTYYKYVPKSIDYFVKDTKVNQILVKTDSKKTPEEIRKMVFEKYPYLRAETVGPFMSIVDKRADKVFGVDFITEKLNIKKENVYTIGDNNNDINMIKKYNGFALENSIEEVKSVASKEFKEVKDAIESI